MQVRRGTHPLRLKRFSISKSINAESFRISIMLKPMHHWGT